MKRMVWIGIVVFLVVAACARPDDDPVETRFIASPTIIVSPELSAIDSLMWCQPDSALALLLPYFDSLVRQAPPLQRGLGGIKQTAISQPKPQPRLLH